MNPAPDQQTAELQRQLQDAWLVIGRQQVQLLQQDQLLRMLQEKIEQETGVPAMPEPIPPVPASSETNGAESAHKTPPNRRARRSQR